MNRLCTYVVGLSLVVLPGLSFAENVPSASATVPVTKDALSAREKALSEALGQALEQAVLGAAPEARGRLYLISARAREYVITYRVLEEGEVSGMFQIRIAAQVDLPRALLDLRLGKPTPVASPNQGPSRSILLCADGPEQDRAELLAAFRQSLRAASVPNVMLLQERFCPKDESITEESLKQAASAAKATVGLLARRDGTKAQAGPIRGTHPPQVGASETLRLVVLSDKGDRQETEAEASEFASSEGTPKEQAQTAAKRAASALCLSKSFEAVYGKGPSPKGAAPSAPTDGVLVTFLGASSHSQVNALYKTLAALPGVAGADIRKAGPGQVVHYLLRTKSPAESLSATLGRTPIANTRISASVKGPRHIQAQIEAEVPQPPGSTATP